MASDVLLITCACGQRMRVPAEAMGKKATCVKCGEKINISPETAAAPGDTPPSNPQATSAAQAQQAGSSSAEPAPLKPEEREGAAAVQEPSEPSKKSREQKEVIQLLLDEGFINKDQLTEARTVQEDLPGNTWEILIQIGHLLGDDFHSLMSKQDNLTNIDLSNYKVPGDVLTFVPKDIIYRGTIFPVDKLGKLLSIAMACPLDTAIIQETEERTGLKVKVLLSHIDDLRHTIHEYFPEKLEQAAYDDAFGKELIKEFGDTVTSNPVAKRLYELPPLKPLSGTVRRLGAIDTGSPEALKQTLEVLNLDPAAACQLLSIANSGAYGFPKRVDNLALAVTLVGVRAIQEVFAGLDTVDPEQDGGFDYRGFLHAATYCARAAQAIAAACNSQRGLSAHAAGLLHEIGRLGLDAVLPASYSRLTQGLSGERLRAKEMALYHYSHLEAGYLLVRKWNLPPSISEPLRCRNAPEEARKSKEVVAIVHLASRLAVAHDTGEPPSFSGSEMALQELNLTTDQVESISREVTVPAGG